MSVTPEQVDALLPQTQCGLCGYGGCLPYAEAMVFAGAPIHLCPPGGVTTLCALSELLGQDPAPYLPEMEQKTKPHRIAAINEALCIGCTKCIQACPVDAILGSAKQMHTIIASECTGCELCIAPCPVDCITMQTVPAPATSVAQQVKADQYRARFQAREQRLKREKMAANKKLKADSLAEKKKYIQEAITRAKEKKNSQCDLNALHSPASSLDHSKDR